MLAYFKTGFTQSSPKLIRGFIVIAVAVVANILLLHSPVFADDRPNSFRLINTFTISATCDSGPCFWDYAGGSDGGIGITDIADKERIYIRSTPPADLCKDVIAYNSRFNIWQRWVVQKTGDTCAGNTGDPQDVSVANPNGLYTYWYQKSDGSLSSVSGSGSSWTRVTGATMSAGGVSGLSELYVQQGGSTCPAMILGYSSGTWGYIAPKVNTPGLTENDAASVYYRKMATAAGLTAGGDCLATVWMDDKGWNPDSLAANVSRSGTFFRNESDGTISFNDLKSSVYKFPTKPFGPQLAVMGTTATGEAYLPDVASLTGGDSDNATSCVIDGIGWIVCPVMNFIAGLNDGLYDFIASMLVVNPELFNINSTTYKAWDIFKNYANVMFVIAFLIIIYSQVTSVGIGNYGIKRMLPKLIIAAILVNISFFVCQLAVDLSNIFGYGIKSLFDQLGGAVAITATAPAGGWGEIIGQILAGVLGVGAALALLLSISVPVLLAAFFALALIAFILLARQALIVLLIVIAPLAFVAYLLPNTESLFKKWWKLFSSLLMLFPVIAAVFGASALAAVILSASGEPVMKIAALAATAIPLFVVPGMLKGALAATGKLGAKMQGWGDKATSGVGSAVKNRSQLGTTWQEARKHKQQQHAIGMAKNRGTGLSGVVGRVGGGKGYNEKAKLRASSLENEEYENDVKAADQMLLQRSYSEKMAIANGDTSASEAERDAAVRFMMSSGNHNERREVLSSAGSMTDRQRRSAVGGARTKGDSGVYGSVTLGNIEEGRLNGHANVAAQLDAGAVQRIEAGEVTPETFARDTYTATYLTGQVQNVAPDAQLRFAQTINSYMASEQGQKTASATRDQATRVMDIATAPRAPQPPQPGTP